MSEPKPKTEQVNPFPRAMVTALVVLVALIGGVWVFFAVGGSDATLGLGSDNQRSGYGLLESDLDPDKEYSSAIGYYAAPFRLRGSGGTEIDFASDIAGRDTLLVIGATWCTFCKQEIPTLDRIQKEGKVQLVEVSSKENPKIVDAHLELNGIEHPWYYDESGEVSDWYFLAGTPTHVFINDDGKILARETGYKTYDELDEQIQKLLES